MHLDYLRVEWQPRGFKWRMVCDYRRSVRPEADWIQRMLESSKSGEENVVAVMEEPFSDEQMT